MCNDRKELEVIGEFKARLVLPSTILASFGYYLLIYVLISKIFLLLVERGATVLNTQGLNCWNWDKPVGPPPLYGLRHLSLIHI